MQFFRDNRILLLLGAIAWSLALYFYFIGNSNPTFEVKNTPKPEVLYTITADQKQQFESYFQNKIKQGFNGVVLIGQKDSVFYNLVHGFANFQDNDSLNIRSTFQLASVSKQFTAVAILQLYQKSLLKLTDSVTRFFPDFPYPEITIQQLLTHRSGVPNYLYFSQQIPDNPDSLLTNQAVISELIIRKPPAYFNPNRRYHYSNTGYAILAAIVEQITQQPFNEYLSQNIFMPLGMTQTYTYCDKPNIKDSNSTLGYIYRWKMADDNLFDGVLGDKGIYSSATDLFKWDQGLYKNIIIDTAVLQLAFQPMGKPQNFSNNYGYGWRMFDHRYDSIKVIYHGGWWHGYKTLLVRIPQDSTTIIVLKNRSSGVKISTNQLVNILYPNNTSISDSLDLELVD